MTSCQQWKATPVTQIPAMLSLTSHCGQLGINKYLYVLAKMSHIKAHAYRNKPTECKWSQLKQSSDSACCQKLREPAWILFLSFLSPVLWINLLFLGSFHRATTFHQMRSSWKQPMFMRFFPIKPGVTNSFEVPRSKPFMSQWGSSSRGHMINLRGCNVT